MQAAAHAEDNEAASISQSQFVAAKIPAATALYRAIRTRKSNEKDFLQLRIMLARRDVPEKGSLSTHSKRDVFRGKKSSHFAAEP